ncbi:MAG TPA: ankyrin repeat domain-containing protein [Gemmatimonadaceae bacterium]|nr:ankyrin repeat domain-containing protein [Gemmatimonadaceae bacterium]
MPHRRRVVGTLAAVAAVALLAAWSAPGSPIADAAMKGDLTRVRTLISQGASVSAPQGDGMTALHWAAERGDSAMAEVLVRAHADLRAVTRVGGYTPLHVASKAGGAAVVKVLLRAGSDVNALTANGATPLHFAAGAGNEEAVSALLNRGANANAREPEWGQTPLIFAAEYDRAAAIRVLLKHGADPSVHTRVVNLTEDAAREQAAMRRRNEVLVSFEPEKHRDTAKTAALPGADVPIPAMTAPAQVLTTQQAAPGQALTVQPPAGGRVGGRGGRGGPPAPTPKGPFTASQIQQAIEAGRVVLTAPASAKGPMTEEVDTINGGIAGYVGAVGGVGGLTALHHAIRQGNKDAVVALLDGGASINDSSGVDHTTPLLEALINGQFDIAKLLIERHADPNVASSSGNTPLYAVINTQWAPRTRFPQPQDVQNQRTSYLELMTALLKAGANPNARLKQQFWYFSYNNCGNANCGLENIDGTTPFWRAAYAVDVDAMRLLVSYGADPNVPSLRAPQTGRGGGAAGGAAGGGGGGRGQAPPPPLDPATDSAAKAVPPGLGVYPIHSAAGVGYGNGFAGNAHRHAPDGWMPAMKYLVEELHADVNQRDVNGYTPLHHAAARGDNEMILYLVSKGADPKAVSRQGRTTVDMANGPVQRLRPFPETIALLEKMGAKNSHRCVGC